MNNDTLLWTKNHPDGQLANPAYPGDAGLDLTAIETVVITSGTTERVAVGINIALPEGYCVICMSRSSLVANGLLAMPTLIDSGYRGPLFAFVANLSTDEAIIEAGTRIAQLLPIKAGLPELSVLQVDKLPLSVRGKNGFGSSGDAVVEQLPDENPEAYFDRISKEKGINEHRAETEKLPRTAEEHRGRVITALQSFEGSSSSISEDVTTYFGINPNWGTKTNGKVLQFLMERKTLSESIKQFAGWWYEHDFRGVRGQPPTTTQIMELWPQAFGFSVTDTQAEELDDDLLIGN